MTFSVSRACMLLPRHRTFTGCEVDSNCVAEAMLHLILLYARQLLRKESDVNGEEEVRLCADVYVKAI